MTDFLSLAMENTKSVRCFNNRNRSVSIQTRNLRILPTETFKYLKDIAQNVFANILISSPHENFSPHYQSGF